MRQWLEMLTDWKDDQTYQEIKVLVQLFTISRCYVLDQDSLSVLLSQLSLIIGNNNDTNNNEYQMVAPLRGVCVL